MNMSMWLYSVAIILMYAGNFLGASGSPEPKWSNQVETHLLLSAVRGPEMIDAKVYYDRERNELAVLLKEVKEERTLGDEKLLIYRFEEEARMSIIGHKCGVGPDIERTEKSIPFLEAKGTNGTKKLKNFGSLFFFDPVNYAKQVDFNWNATETTKWESSFVNVEGFGLHYCNLTHYVTTGANSEPEEDIFSSFLKIEALCLIEADDVSEEIEFVIDFFWSKNSISDAEIFQQPPGVYCPFVNSTRSFPSLSLYFSFDFTTFDSDKETGNNLYATSFRKKIWFDSSNKLVRKDNLDWKFVIQMTMIGDYNSRLSYIITPSGECTINELKENDTMERGISLPGENFPLFPGSTANIPQYVGQRKRHGITFDVWANKDSKGDMIEVSDYYFTYNVYSEDNINITYPPFIEVFMLTPEEKYIGSVLQLVGSYRSKPDVDDQSIFDVTNCFLESNKTRFFVTFEGDVESIDQKGLRENVWRKLLSSLNVERMRLGAIEILFMDEFSIVLSSSVVEDPKRLGFKQGKEGPSREQALKTLSELIKGRKLNISVSRLTEPRSETVTLTATKLSFPFSDMDDKDGEPHKGKKGGFSSGALAGVGIAMLVVGMFQGVVLLVAYIRYRKDNALVRKLTASEQTPANS